MMLRKKSFDASLCEELPYWEFFDAPRPHGVLSDGSLVAGIKLPLIDIECFDGCVDDYDLDDESEYSEQDLAEFS